MPTWATVIRRHGIARTGRLGSLTRRHALAMGDPRFSLKRALTIPRKIRQGIMGTAFNVIGGVPIVGGALQAAIRANPSAFPNITAIQPTMAGGGGAGSMALAPMDIPPASKNPMGIGPHTLISHGRHRRMNWANPRALGRAERRLGSFVKHFTKHARHLGFHVSRGPRGRAHLPRRKR